MGPKRKNKKINKGTAAQAENEATTSATASETPAPTSYAAATAQPTIEGSEVVHTSSTNPPTAGDASTTNNAKVSATEPAEASTTPGLVEGEDVPGDAVGASESEDDSGELLDLPKFAANAAGSSGDDAFGDSSSDLSRLKKDEISDADSRARLLNVSSDFVDPISEDPASSSSSARPRSSSDAEYIAARAADGQGEAEDSSAAGEFISDAATEPASEKTAATDDNLAAGPEAGADLSPNEAGSDGAAAGQPTNNAASKPHSDTTAALDHDDTAGPEGGADSPVNGAGIDGTTSGDATGDAATEPAPETTATPDNHNAAEAEVTPDLLQTAFAGTSTSLAGKVMTDRGGWSQSFSSGSSSQPNSETARSTAAYRQLWDIAAELDNTDDTVRLQDCNDRLQRTRRDINTLLRERDDLRAELDMAHEALDDISNLRRDQDVDIRARRAHETTLNARIQVLEAELAQRDAPKPPPPSSSDPSSPGDDGGVVRRLRREIARLRAEIAMTYASLARLQQRQRNTVAFRAGIAGCATQAEKLARFGTSLDVNSPLYAVLRKLATAGDDGSGEAARLTRAEAALLERFRATLAERKFVMAQAQHSEDPRPFLEPFLDGWDGGEDDWGSTLRDRIMATRQALDRLTGPERVVEASNRLSIS